MLVKNASKNTRLLKKSAQVNYTWAEAISQFMAVWFPE